MNRNYDGWTDHELALLRNAEGELTATQLADQLPGRSRGDVHMACERMDIPFRRQWRRRTWASEPQSLEIVKAGKEAGLTSEEVAVELAKAGYPRSAGAIRRVWNSID